MTDESPCICCSNNTTWRPGYDFDLPDCIMHSQHLSDRICSICQELDMLWPYLPSCGHTYLPVKCTWAHAGVLESHVDGVQHSHWAAFIHGGGSDHDWFPKDNCKHLANYKHCKLPNIASSMIQMHDCSSIRLSNTLIHTLQHLDLPIAECDYLTQLGGIHAMLSNPRGILHLICILCRMRRSSSLQQHRYSTICSTHS